MIKRCFLSLFLLMLVLNVYSDRAAPELKIWVDNSLKYQIDSLYIVPVGYDDVEAIKVDSAYNFYEESFSHGNFKIKVLFINGDTLVSQPFYSDDDSRIEITTKNNNVQFVLQRESKGESNIPSIIINILFFILLKIAIPLFIFKPSSKTLFIVGIIGSFLLGVLFCFLFVPDFALIGLILNLALDISIYLKLNKEEKRTKPILIALLSNILYWVLLFVLNVYLMLFCTF